MEMKEEDYLAHYGILRKSGRYPWGSGATQSQRNKMFLDTVRDLKRQGMTDAEIAKGFSTDKHPFTSTMLVDLRSIAVNQQRQEKINQVVRLKEKGMSDTAIGKRMGINESSVRSLKAASEKRNANILEATTDMLRRQVDEKGAIDIGTQVERDLPIGDNPNALIGVSRDKFRAAVRAMEEKGYKTHTVKVNQLGSPGNRTTIKVLARPDVKWVDLKNDPAKIKLITEKSDDGGESYQGLGPLKSVSSKRLKVRYAEDGGTDADGVIFLRRGVKDLDMGPAQYAQVRIPVDGTHYIKGMAIYKDDLPSGVDMVFNTNKSNTGNKLDALKEMNKNDDGTVNKDNPFGAVIKPGGRKEALNIVYEEGDWDNWSRTLPSQMLSKQTPKLIEDQLGVTHERRVKEFSDIKALTNPTIKKKLLETFADETDSAAVHLKAANLPHQATKVLLPVPSVKPTEIYAPSFRNGERVALVRFPHGGTFEIPELTVNNRNPQAKKLLGERATDAVGIHHKVAERLSGADFDGDTAVVIPNNRGSVKSTPPLEGLKGFDPKQEHPPYDGMPTVDGGRYNAKTGKVDYGKDKDGNPKKPNNHMQKQMGDISNLITDMTLQGANTSELARAVRHSMVVIDSEKHVLDYKGSAQRNGIPALKEKYQGKKNAGAATLLSKAGSPVRLPKRKPRPAKDGGPIDRETGQKKFVETGEHYTDKKTGKRVDITQEHERLSVTEDAHTLSSGTRQEHLYADYSNRLKAMANSARKEMLITPNLEYKPDAAKVYKREVDSLEKNLDIALRNAPRERQAQAIANSIVNQTKAANPHMDKDDLKKLNTRALHEARDRTGANKARIDVTPEEWRAIQAGAVSDTKLRSILQNANLETVRALATPHNRPLMTSTMASRARGMIAAGYTQREIADQLGISLSTLKEGLK